MTTRLSLITIMPLTVGLYLAVGCSSSDGGSSAAGPAPVGTDAGAIDSADAVTRNDTGSQDVGTPPDAEGGTDEDVSGEVAETTPEPRPVRPGALVSYLTGNPEDADVAPDGPAVILMGGGTDVDAAFDWWTPRLGGGDIVVLRTSGSDGYNDYLYSEFGTVDSVETLIVDSRELADSDYVRWALLHAEGIFMAGGDQATYLEYWKDTAVSLALVQAWKRGAVIGGTSAGCAVLGQFAFAAYNDTVYSDEALDDPYNQYMTLDGGFLPFGPLLGVITDTHFAERDRMGRLVGFIARLVQDGEADAVVGIGVDERTALAIAPDGTGTVLGSGAVYLVHSNGPPTQCQAGSPLEYVDVARYRLTSGDTVALPAGVPDQQPLLIDASDGALTPNNPYE